MNNKLSIGVDYGGVCSVHVEKYESDSQNIKTSKKENANIPIDVPDCLDSLRVLKSLGHRLVLISFCGSSRARKTRAMLEPLGLFDMMYFVKDRNYKQLVCQKEGIDVMIDDRIDILQTIKKTKTLLFNGPSAEPIKNIPESKDILEQGHNADEQTTTPNNYKPDYTANSWVNVVTIIQNSVIEKNLPTVIDLSKKLY